MDVVTKVAHYVALCYHVRHIYQHQPLFSLWSHLLTYKCFLFLQNSDLSAGADCSNVTLMRTSKIFSCRNLAVCYYSCTTAKSWLALCVVFSESGLLPGSHCSSVGQSQPTVCPTYQCGTRASSFLNVASAVIVFHVTSGDSFILLSMYLKYCLPLNL